MEVPCRPEGPDDRENRFWQKSESNERGDRPWGSAVSRSHEQEYIHAYVHIYNAHGVRERFASSRLATVSTILARTGGGKFGNKICSRQLDRARCQKRLLILYRASSISCQVLIRLRIRRGWMLFNIQKGLPSARRRAHVEKRKYETPADRYPKINNARLAWRTLLDHCPTVTAERSAKSYVISIQKDG